MLQIFCFVCIQTERSREPIVCFKFNFLGARLAVRELEIVTINSSRMSIPDKNWQPPFIKLETT